jgi:hypothetical protein
MSMLHGLRVLTAGEFERSYEKDRFEVRFHLYHKHIGGYGVWYATTRDAALEWLSPFHSLGYHSIWGYVNEDIRLLEQQKPLA